MKVPTMINKIEKSKITIGFTQLVSNPIFQTTINTIAVIITGIYCSNAVDKNKNINIGKLIIVVIAYCAIEVGFTYINNRVRKNEKKYYVKSNILDCTIKTMKIRNQKLINGRKKEIFSSILSENVQDTYLTLCDNLYTSIADYYQCDRQNVEVILFQQFYDKNTEKLVLKAAAYGALDTPACVGKVIDKGYRIMDLFKDCKMLKYMNREEVKSGFIYKEIPSEISEEARKNNEKIAQYIALPIKTRNNFTIGVLQLVFYDIIIKEKDSVFIIENFLKPYCVYIESLICEQKCIERLLENGGSPNGKKRLYSKKRSKEKSNGASKFIWQKRLHK